MTCIKGLHLVAAIGERTRAIGKDNALLWRIPEDLRRFRKITVGHPVVMGRKTFESLKIPLSERTNIVVSRTPRADAPSLLWRQTLEEALKEAFSQNRVVFVIGGAELYRQTLPMAERLYLTLVDDDTPGDAFFPEGYEAMFPRIIEKKSEVDPLQNLKFTFVARER